MKGLQPSKENIQHFKTLNFLTFFGVSIAFRKSDPDPTDQNQLGPLRIRIHNIGHKNITISYSPH
jgi:hypothetical protein